MKPIDELNREFSAQDFTDGDTDSLMLDRYKEIARNYARMENNIAVLSDLRTNVSYIYLGGFAQTLGIKGDTSENKIPSIWEEGIFRLIHPDDLTEKHLQELRFFHFIKQQPKTKRSSYYMMSRIRIKTGTASYIPAIHRIFYISIPPKETLWLTLCLYSPLSFELPSKCVIVDSATGYTTELEKQNGIKILSTREKQILSLINKGLTSKEIAQSLSISIHTVNRHRQEILSKLQVKNAIEACRTAKDLKLI